MPSVTTIMCLISYQKFSGLKHLLVHVSVGWLLLADLGQVWLAVGPDAGRVSAPPVSVSLDQWASRAMFSHLCAEVQENIHASACVTSLASQ